MKLLIKSVAFAAALGAASLASAQSWPVYGGDTGEEHLSFVQGAGHGGWQEMPQDTERMVEWFDLQLLGKQPKKPFTLNVSSLPSTPVIKTK